MATLSEQQRDRLRRDQFAYVDGEGGEHLPINDESHVRNAISRFNQTEIESAEDRRQAARKILAAAKRHGIEVDEDSHVARAAQRGSSRDS